MLHCVLLCDVPPLSPVVMNGAIKSNRKWGAVLMPLRGLRKVTVIYSFYSFAFKVLTTR